MWPSDKYKFNSPVTWEKNKTLCVHVSVCQFSQVHLSLPKESEVTNLELLLKGGHDGWDKGEKLGGNC